MKFSKQTNDFAKHLITCYAKFDEDEKRYVIDIDAIADFDIDHLAALIMMDYPGYANESCGSDNNEFFNTMLPKLQMYMLNTTNKDSERDFARAWKDGVSKYFMPEIENLLSLKMDEWLFP